MSLIHNFLSTSNSADLIEDARFAKQWHDKFRQYNNGQVSVGHGDPYMLGAPIFAEVIEQLSNAYIEKNKTPDSKAVNEALLANWNRYPIADLDALSTALMATFHQCTSEIEQAKSFGR